jgi:murein DD-endopeptidase MepM/ murein hydrolase activator NlpD
VRGATRLISASQLAFNGSVDLGHEPPLRIGEKPDKEPVHRSVSPRWLAGTILTGFTSIFLMGGALMAALDSPFQFASLPDSFGAVVDGSETPGGKFGGGKGDRIQPLQEEVSSRQILQVSTVTRQGERDFIKLRPFAKVTASLVAPKPETADRIPAYDALRIFADTSAPEAPAAPGAGADQIYGADVDGEVSVKVSAFPIDGADAIAGNGGLTTSEVEQVVRAAANLNAAPAEFQTASIPYAEPGEDYGDGEDPFSAVGVKIVPENVSSIAKSDGATPGSSIEEKIISVADKADFRGVLTGNAVSPADADAIARTMAGLIDISRLRADQKIRVAYAVSGETGTSSLMRVSIYEDGAHQATVARADDNLFVRADEPTTSMAMTDAKDELDTYSGGMPKLYDAVYETALEQQVPAPLIDQLIRIFAFDVDFQARITPGDTLEVFHSLPDTQDRDAAEPEVLYASLTLGGVNKRFYRFRTSDDGIIDYYDAEGRSAKKFLMRKPMGSGIIRSGFGWRVHPILGYRRLHAGVDYAAPKGTPIVAAGNGVVEKAGRSSGYGNFTLIKHTNGYETAYGHQSAYAKGIVPGARVRQGQIIGYVGSTGLSTGPHLHFEIRVNAKAVDPLRIRLPRGRVLQADLLKNFEHERDRINALLGAPPQTSSKVASTN